MIVRGRNVVRRKQKRTIVIKYSTAQDLTTVSNRVGITAHSHFILKERVYVCEGGGNADRMRFYRMRFIWDLTDNVGRAISSSDF